MTDVLRIAKSAGRVTLALFVDDGLFAVTIIGWVALVAVGMVRLRPSTAYVGPLLVNGLVAIFLLSVWRAAHRTAGRRS
jgi:hypothetical protein